MRGWINRKLHIAGSAGAALGAVLIELHLRFIGMILELGMCGLLMIFVARLLRKGTKDKGK